jgi:hypothetical protein
MMGLNFEMIFPAQNLQVAGKAGPRNSLRKGLMH